MLCLVKFNLYSYFNVYRYDKAFIVSSICYWKPWYPTCIPPPRRPINNFPPLPNNNNNRSPPPPVGLYKLNSVYP